jgi:riboflavin synthase
VFTGIIEHLGTITDIQKEGSNKHFWITSPITTELKIDQSVAHNGVCLTVVEIKGNTYKVTAIDETLQRTHLNQSNVGDIMNMERCMLANGRFDGHIVQGHVDDVAVCKNIENKDGSWIFTFKINTASNQNMIVEKGSICVNGISLTVASVKGDEFSVAIIPYTFHHTNMNKLIVRSLVNIEYDIIGKYISKMLSSR